MNKSAIEGKEIAEAYYYTSNTIFTIPYVVDLAV